MVAVVKSGRILNLDKVNAMTYWFMSGNFLCGMCVNFRFLRLTDQNCHFFFPQLVNGCFYCLCHEQNCGANSIALIWVQLPPWVWARLTATIQQITNGDTVHIMLENRKLDVQRSKRGRRAQLKHLERRNVPSPQLISKWKPKPGMQRKAVERSRLWKEVSVSILWFASEVSARGLQVIVW